MKEIVYSSTLLNGTGKKGIVKPSGDGYYTQCIGALGIKNAAGVVYDARIGAKLFEESGDLMRRLRNGNLKGEAGHPRREPWMTDKQWFMRCADIVEPNVCVYWADIGLDPDYGRKNPQLGEPNMVGIMGRFRPGGPKGDYLARDMEDPNTNVCFSIRSVSEPFMYMGRKNYGLISVATFDHVTEPGLGPANKWQSITCESLAESRFSEEVIQDVARDLLKMPELAMESNSGVRSLIKTLQPHVAVPTSKTFIGGWK